VIRAGIVAMGLALVSPVTAVAQENCDSHARVLIHLAEHYGEVRQVAALGAGNTLVETWANLTTGTWTITVTPPGALTCIVASGGDFTLVNLPA
jgi:hypothetical protein